MLRQDSYHVRQ